MSVVGGVEKQDYSYYRAVRQKCMNKITKCFYTQDVHAQNNAKMNNHLTKYCKFSNLAYCIYIGYDTENSGSTINRYRYIRY